MEITEHKSGSYIAPGDYTPNFLQGYESFLHLQLFSYGTFGFKVTAEDEMHFQSLKVSLL